ncbi:MAG: hypothetical protein ACR2JG_12230 [Geodermatophilaceae bacterium]
MTRFQSVAPVLPTRDVAASLALYAKLGFKTQSYEGPAGYGYARRDDVYLHFTYRPPRSAVDGQHDLSLRRGCRRIARAVARRRC